MDCTDGEAPSRDALAALRQRARDIVAGRAKPYTAGRAMRSEALAADDETGQCHALWLLWGALTDWVENKPAEIDEAEAAMRRAATEWLEVADDELRWRPYFDRWLYDECGYTRRSPQTVYVELLDEDVEVWRPVAADVEAGDVFRLPRLAAAGEAWRFPPGSRVRCQWRQLPDGCFLVAAESAE